MNFVHTGASYLTPEALPLPDAVKHPASPLLLYAGLVLLTAAVVTLSNPNSLVRPGALPLAASFTYLVLLSAPGALGRRWAVLISGVTLSFFLQYVDLCIFSKSGSRFNSRNAANGLTKRKDQKTSNVRQSPEGIIRRLWSGVERTLSFRNPSTVEEIRNTPYFSSNPDYLPSKSTYLLSSMASMTACFLVMYLLSLIPAPKDPLATFSWSRVPLFANWDNLRPAELQDRAMKTIIHWIGAYCTMLGLWLFGSLVCVGLGLSPVRTWRPLFGSLQDAYTLQLFWGKFWHQLLRRVVSNPAKALTRNVLRFPDRSLATRYVQAGLTFLISGLLHALADTAGGLPLNKSGTVRCYVTQVLGFALEDFVQFIWHRYVNGGKRPVKTPMWGRLVGYLWVSAFLIWSMPARFYPVAARRGYDELLPAK